MRSGRFTREELIDVIAKGDDKVLNVLIIDDNGRFRMVQPPKVDTMEDPKVAVYHEAFVDGNGYVGKKASQDRSFIEETYLSMLQGWVEYLETGQSNVYVDETTDKTERELWKQTEAIE